MRRIAIILSVVLFSLFAIPINAKDKTLPLHELKMPPGFAIHIYADVPHARSLALGADGVVFVGTRKTGKVYALIPNKNGTHAKKVILIADSMTMPNGVAYRNGNLYVAEMTRIWKYPDIEKHLNGWCLIFVDGI